MDETLLILYLYARFAEEYMAIPVIKGIKTASERFAGADETYCIEGLMQDGKALQCGTSHFLGQNFAKAFDCQFQNKDNELEYVWATSWGVSTRLIGAMVMTHSDDHGLVLPPRLAPTQVVIVPIYRKEEDQATVIAAAREIRDGLKAAGISVKLDDREGQRPGWKFHEYDIENRTVEVARRDTRTKEVVSMGGLTDSITQLLEDIQRSLYDRALAFREEHTTAANSYDELKSILDEKGGFVLAHWDGTTETEALIKNETKATIRCIPLDQQKEDGADLVTGKPSGGRVLFARAY
jgi:prolyl-tRNA synthetase